MIKTLYLVRHAKSDWSEPGQKDFDRGLNARGHAQAPRMGHWLAEQKIKPSCILSSPALRAKLTCNYFIEQIGITEEEVVFVDDLYDASLRILLKTINELDDACTDVMIFGHNPGFTYLAEYLTKKELGNVPTSAIVCIQFETEHWAEISGGTGNLVFFEYPSKFLVEEDD